jgi:hypothetical protein
MQIKHKVLKDFQLLTEDNKIIILKAKTILEDFKYKNKSEFVTIPSEIIKNNPDYFAFIDWKEDLQSYLKINKIPQPAVITKKLLPFIENLIGQLGSKTKEVIVEKLITIEKEVFKDSPENSTEIELKSKLEKIKILENKLKEEIVETNKKEADFITKSIQLETEGKNLKKDKENLNHSSEELKSKTDKLNELEKKLNNKLSDYNNLIRKTDLENLIDELPKEIPNQFHGYFGNSMQQIELSQWYKNQLNLIITKINNEDII